MEQIKKNIIELIIVAFGVFLGVYVGEWNTQNKVDENTNKTLNYLVVELESNIKKFDEAILYHTQISKEIDSLWNTLEPEDKNAYQYESTKFLYNKLPSWNAIGTVSPDDIVYESAKISGVFQEIDISSTRLIANAYKIMKHYSKASSITLEKMIAINSTSRVSDVYSVFYLLKYDVLPLEYRTLKILKSTKEELKKRIE